MGPVTTTAEPGERTNKHELRQCGLPQHQSKLLPTPSDNGLISTRPGGGWWCGRRDKTASISDLILPEPARQRDEPTKPDKPASSPSGIRLRPSLSLSQQSVAHRHLQRALGLEGSPTHQPGSGSPPTPHPRRVHEQGNGQGRQPHWTIESQLHRSSRRSIVQIEPHEPMPFAERHSQRTPSPHQHQPPTRNEAPDTSHPSPSPITTRPAPVKSPSFSTTHVDGTWNTEPQRNGPK